MKELVFNQNGATLTNSLLVAEKFGKRHGDVLRAIKDLIDKVPGNQCERIFGEYDKRRIKQPNGGFREEPIFSISKDGFVLLTMGFTGKKALEFKLQYIEAFNKMEAELKQITSAPQFNIPTTLSGALRLAAEQAEVIETQQKQIAEQSQSISYLTPKAQYTEKVLSSSNTISITQIAKDYGMTGVALNKKLNLMGVIYKVNNQWVLYKKHEGKGYTKSITYCDDYGRSYIRTEWTQIGRQFIDSLIR